MRRLRKIWARMYRASKWRRVSCPPSSTTFCFRTTVDVCAVLPRKEIVFACACRCLWRSDLMQPPVASVQLPQLTSNLRLVSLRSAVPTCGSCLLCNQLNLWHVGINMTVFYAKGGVGQPSSALTCLCTSLAAHYVVRGIQ